MVRVARRGFFRGGGAATEERGVAVGRAATDHGETSIVRAEIRRHTYTAVPAAAHELWLPNYLEAIKSALDRIGAG